MKLELTNLPYKSFWEELKIILKLPTKKMPGDPVAPRNNEEQTLAMENNETPQDVLSRASNLPLVNSTYEMAASVYTSTKENHPYVKVVLDLAEKNVKHVSEMAMSSAQPFLSKLEPQVSVASHYASKGLDKLEENLPFLHQTVDQVISETQELVSSKVADVKEAVAKVVQDGKEMIIDTRMGKLAISGVEAVLEKSEELLDHYLPMTDEELAKIAHSTSEGIALPPESQGYFVQLGSLSTKLQHRAYKYAVVKMKAARENIQNTFSQLHQAIGQMESHTLAMSYHITEQLQMAYMNLMGSIQGLPGIFQQNIKSALHSIEELQATFTDVNSFKDLSSSLLIQSKKTASMAQKYVDDILDYVLQNTPLSWLVGPFIPALKNTSDDPEPAKPNEREVETLKPESPKETQ
ncbi:perilipin-3-like isoform X2 [Crotalus tigris]|uniref:perilipin-3-like isoform X2 n=1 Tax=Crotalus tigris TaxID=88082 RepID=UPI00192F321D|nr:perilipin-3-like isoform X2 [Crotalus tigris]